jgi:hypothetical protein
LQTESNRRRESGLGHDASCGRGDEDKNEDSECCEEEQMTPVVSFHQMRV